MLDRRRWLAASLLFAAGLGTARAATAVPFDQAAFEAAQAAGRPVLVAIAAPWCPICKAQKPILARIGAEPRFRDLAIFEIDFDTQRPLVRQFGARMQSTLIAFKGREEVGRSIGETQPEWLESFVEKLL